MLGISILAGGFVTAVTTTAASAAPVGVDVSVGYADTLRANPANFPTPFGPSSNVLFSGCTPATGTNACPFDAGAVRVINNTGLNQVINSIVVQLNGCAWDMWTHNVTVTPGQQYQVTQLSHTPVEGCNTTAPGSFDTSDARPANVPICTNDGLIPEVDVTVDGVTSVFHDTGQVLNTGGVDRAVCSSPGQPAGNESSQWTPIGSVACPGSTLSLAPPSQTQPLGATATLTGTLVNSCGNPLPGAVVDFGDVYGPNAGLVKSATTGANGKASITYSSTAVGTDGWLASVTNPAGTIFSNAVTVVWIQPVVMTGRAYGLAASGLLRVTPTPDTGSVATSAASTTTTPCFAGVLVPPSLVAANALCANVTTALGPPTSTATASTANAFVGVPGLPISTSDVVATSKSTCAGSSGSTTIAYLKIGGTVINIPGAGSPPPNTTINLVVAKVVLNEQIKTPGSLTVNAVHVSVLGSTQDVVIASATSDIHNCGV